MCPPPKRTINTADRYINRLRKGERIMRTSAGKIMWDNGKRISLATVDYMLTEGMIVQLDTDLFGDLSRGQTIGLPGSAA